MSHIPQAPAQLQAPSNTKPPGSVPSLQAASAHTEPVERAINTAEPTYTFDHLMLSIMQQPFKHPEAPDTAVVSANPNIELSLGNIRPEKLEPIGIQETPDHDYERLEKREFTKLEVFREKHINLALKEIDAHTRMRAQVLKEHFKHYASTKNAFAKRIACALTKKSEVNLNNLNLTHSDRLLFNVAQLKFDENMREYLEILVTELIRTDEQLPHEAMASQTLFYSHKKNNLLTNKTLNGHVRDYHTKKEEFIKKLLLTPLYESRSGSRTMSLSLLASSDLCLLPRIQALYDGVLNPYCSDLHQTLVTELIKADEQLAYEVQTSQTLFYMQKEATLLTNETLNGHVRDYHTKKEEFIKKLLSTTLYSTGSGPRTKNMTLSHIASHDLGLRPRIQVLYDEAFNSYCSVLHQTHFEASQSQHTQFAEESLRNLREGFHQANAEGNVRDYIISAAIDYNSSLESYQERTKHLPTHKELANSFYNAMRNYRNQLLEYAKIAGLATQNPA